MANLGTLKNMQLKYNLIFSGLKLKPQIFPGGTDSRFVRDIGVPAIGFSPINNTPILLHDHNEYLNKDVFVTGINIYYKAIKAVADLEDRTG